MSNEGVPSSAPQGEIPRQPQFIKQGEQTQLPNEALEASAKGAGEQATQRLSVLQEVLVSIT